MPNSTKIKTLTLSDGTYNNTLPLEDTTARNSIASLAASLAPVATSGSYNDLANKPDIPEELVVDFSQNGSTWECDTPVWDIINAMASNVRVYALKDGLIFDGARYDSSNEYVEFIARAKNMIFCLTGIYNGVVDDWNLATYTSVDYDDYQSDMAGKQNTLVSGNNIKTLNGQSLLGSGNISIQGSGGGEANVIETVKVNGTALVPDANKAVNVTVPTQTSQLINDSGFLTSHQDISGKADRVSGSVTGHIAELDANGNLADGGVLASDVEDAVTKKHTHSNKEYLDKIPSSNGTNGQVLTSNGTSWSWQTPGSGGLTDYDFTELTAPTISGGAASVTFAANQRNGVEMATNADLSIALVSNNKADNYIWVTNSHLTDDIDVMFSSISFGATTINDVKGTDSLPTIKAGETVEIGIYVTNTKARITSRIL